MKRKRMHDLKSWFGRKDRKPLVIRGARQVGKTWLVRHFAENLNVQLIEINFEKDPKLLSLFSSNEPKTIVRNLESWAGKLILDGNTLLFLDEIQACPEILAKLRWFAEEMPELPVITAGSLLEFILKEHEFSMPVGRINYLYLEPLSFEEFVLATNNASLLQHITEYEISSDLPDALHDRILNLFKDYLLIGGMPAAVSSWTNEHSTVYVNQIQHDLLATYRDDFSKYRKNVPVNYLDDVMTAIPRFLGNRFYYSKVQPENNARTIKSAFDLLEKARLCHKVQPTSANGAELKATNFKALFIDVGLAGALLGLTHNQLDNVSKLELVNKGAVAEQVVGQLLRTLFPSYIDPHIYFWQRQKSGSQAEVDYIFQHENTVVPIEVKAGSIGTLKSLHIFIQRKGLQLAVRIYSGKPSISKVDTKTPSGNTVEYTLLSIPFYMISELQRLIATLV